MASSVQIPVTQTGLEASIQAALKNAGKNATINLGANARQINALSQPLGRITGQADEFTKSMEAANARVFAFGASVGIINTVSNAFSALVKNTIAVEKSLVEINTVLGTSSSELDKFGGKLFEVAKNTGQSFEAVSKGALELARQGLGTEETLRRINDALILTRLSGLDAGKSVEGLTAAVNSFKSTGITTSEVLNKLVNVSQKYAVSEKDLIEGLKRSSSVAKQAGVSFDELVGVITAVQEKSAVGGAVIGTSFKTIFSRLQKRDTLDALQQLGIEVADVQGQILPATKLLENLAVKIKSLDQIQIAQITEKVGGGYQIDKLISALDDMGSKGSIAFEATKISAEAANEAYAKNAALNKTLANLINETTLSAQELGATLGKLGITDSAKNLLGFFNSLLESIQKVLGEESAIGDVFRGLAKGIGNLITGPGLALFGAIILKLSKDLAQFGFSSLKSFFGIGKAAKEIEAVEKSVANALSTNIGLQRQLFALEGNRAAQIKVMTDAIVQQEAAMRRMASTSSSLAGPLYQAGVRGTNTGLRVPKAAGGYMPAVAQESSDINRGVGGAKSGDRPVVIPNFNFGGGQRGSMVAHTGEYAVPNFAGSGGTAIFNRDMVRSMGLPSGAKKIGAAGGLIPNFANFNIQSGRKIQDAKQDKIDSIKINGMLSSAYITNGSGKISSIGKFKDLQITAKNILNNKFGEISPSAKIIGSGIEFVKIQDLKNKNSSKYSSSGNLVSDIIDLKSKSKGNISILNKGVEDIANKIIPQTKGTFDEGLREQLKSEILSNKPAVLSAGNILEQVLIKTVSGQASEKNSNIWDLPSNVSQAFKSKFGFKSNFGDIKLGISQPSISSFIGKHIINPKGDNILSAAGGFIPNFAFNAETVRQYESTLEDYRQGGKYVFPDGTSGYESQIQKVLGRPVAKATINKQATVTKRQSQMDEKGVMDFVIDANTLGGIALVTPARGGSSGTLTAQSLMQNLPTKPEGFKMDDKLIIKNIQSTGVPTQKNFEQISSEINKRFAGPIVSLAQSLYGKLYSGASGSEFSSQLGQLKSTSKGGILPPGAEGQIFEAAGKAALTSMNQIASAFDPSKENRPFDFTNATSMKEMLGVTAARGDAKRAGGSNRQFQETVNGLIKKSINDDTLRPKIFSQIKQKSKGRSLPENAAGGFIPNFALSPKYIQETLGRIQNGTSGFSAQEQETFLKKFGSSKAAAAKEVSLRYLFDRDGLIGSKGLTDMVNAAYKQSSPTASSDQVYKIFEGMAKIEPSLSGLRRVASQKGFVPNFAQTSNQIGNSGAQGGFYNLQNRFGNSRKYLGIKKFDENLPISALKNPIAREWLSAKYLKNKTMGKMVTGPKIVSGLAQSIKNKSIVKEIIKEPLATNLVGDNQAGIFGTSTLRNYLLQKLGLDIPDLHGRNYTANNAAKPYLLGQKALSDYSADGAKINIIDTGLANAKPETMQEFQKLINQAGQKAQNVKSAAGGFLPNFAIDLTKSEDHTKNQRKRSSKARTYRTASGVIGSLFKSLPDKFFSDGILGDAAQGLETGGILDLIKNNSLYAASFAGPKAVKFVLEAEKYGLKVTKGLQKKLASLTTKAVGKFKGFSSGFLPNFADPLKEAVGREMAAGVPSSQIYIDKNQSLKSAANPMGLMVANHRDEPAGGHQGISRAIKEGRNPKTYGAASGFVPNYVEPKASQSGDSSKIMSSLFMFQVAVSTASGFLDQFGDDGKKASEALQSIATTMLIFGGIALSGPVKRLKELSDTVFKLNKQLSTTTKVGGKFSGLRQGFNKGLSGEGYEFTQKNYTSPSILKRKYNLSDSGLGAAKLGAIGGGLTRGVGAVGGSLARGVGAVVGGVAGPLLVAVGAFKAVADAAKIFTTFSNESAKSLANISVYANKASASLSELDKAAIEAESKRSYGMTFDTFKGSLLNISGINAASSAMSGKNMGNLNYRGRNIRTEDVSEEQFKQSEQAYIASYVGANRTKFANAKDAAGAAAQEFDNFIKSQGPMVTDLSLDFLESQIKTLSDEAIKMQKENALAEALLEAKVQSEIAQKDFINFNKILKSTKDRFTELKKQAFNFENIITAFKAVGESSIDNAYNFSEYDKSVAKLQFSLNGLDASKATKQLSLVAQTQEELTNIAKESIGSLDVLDEASRGRFEDLVSKITSGQDLNIDLEKDLDLARLFGPEYKKTLERVSTEFKLQTLELEKQTSVEKQNLQIETYRSLVAQEMTSGIEAQNKQLELSASNSQKILEYTDKIRESRNKISDVKFERSLIGATESQRLRAEMGRNSLLRSRISEESLIGFRQDRTQSIESLSGMIPSTMSAQNQFDLKSQIQEAIRDVRQQPNLDAVSQLASQKYEEIFNKISETTKKESEARSSEIDKLSEAILGSSVSFTDSVVEAGKKFAGIVSEVKGLPTKLKIEQDLKEFKNQLTEAQKRKSDFDSNDNSKGTTRRNRRLILEGEVQELEKKIAEKEKELSKFTKQQPILSKASKSIANGSSPQNVPKTNISPLSDTDIALEAAKQAETAALENLALSSDVAKDGLDKLNNVQRILADKFAQLAQSAPANIADLQFSQMTSISGKEIAQSRYDEETQRQIKAAEGKSDEEIAKIIRDRQNKPLSQLLSEAFSTTEEERSMNLKNSIVDASVQFKNNMIDGISEAIEGGKSLGDVLQNSAYEFVKAINKQLMSNLVDSVVGSGKQAASGGSGFLSSIMSSIGFASGGKVNGGSGMKDDVPAMLMGGEYVINKKAVQKYGPQFLEALNNGTIGGYAKGGKVQSGKGGFFTPGTYGLGGIEGTRNLLQFATQGYTSGARDMITNTAGYQSIALEPESARLTNLGRSNSPQAEATRAAKEQAFGLYTQEINAQMEAAKQAEAEKDAFKKQLIMLGISAVGGAVMKAGSAGFNNVLKSGGSLTEAFKGVWSGSGDFGGLKNLFSGNFAESQVGNNKELAEYILNNSDTGTMEALKYSSQLTGEPLEYKTSSSSFNPMDTGPYDAQGNYIEAWADFTPQQIAEARARRRATGGSISSRGGIDTVPAMLSGGEFIMNRSAAQNIGAGNLQALNAGAGSIVTEEKTEELNDKLIAKLDELIEASGGGGSITINVEGSAGTANQTTSGQTSEQKQQLARQIKDAVVKVIQEEKRLGGSLRR